MKKAYGRHILLDVAIPGVVGGILHELVGYAVHCLAVKVEERKWKKEQESRRKIGFV